MLTDRIASDGLALVSDPGVWAGWALALVLSLVCWYFGAAIGWRTGILDAQASRWASAGVGLSIGVITLEAGYAAIRAGGATIYLPTAVALVLAMALGRGPIHFARPQRTALVPALGAALFLLGVAAVYGLTVSPSARNGFQPIEFMDEAYYAVLGAQLQSTGLESVFAPAGLGDIPGTPLRAWYHWGEAWLGALVLESGLIGAMHARHMVVLPVLMLTAAAAAGAFVGRFVPRERATEAALLGAFGMLTIAPIPLVLGDHFDWWARPIGFTVTLYGLAFIVLLLGLHLLATERGRSNRGYALLVGATAAALLASHVLVAATAAVGIVAAAAVEWRREGTVRLRGRLTGAAWPIGASAIAIGATFAVGLIAGHGFGDRGTVPGVTPFDNAWVRAVLLAIAGAGVLVVGLLAAARLHRSRPLLFALAIGAAVATAAGAAVWGLRLADFNSFHVFYGAIGVVLTPIAIAGFVASTLSAREAGRRRLAMLGVILLTAQGAVGIGATASRLYEFGPGHYAPVSVAALDWIRALPHDAKLAYACAEVEEVAVWDARLISLTSHTGRPVVPMCFQADVFAVQLGQPADPTLMSPFFAVAPQRAIYPEAGARPTISDVRSFLRRYGIAYILEDSVHRNTLVPTAVERFSDGSMTIYEIP